jgi:hypothetical protein
MRKQLKKALKLARKSHNAVIFFDADSPDDTFAILDLDYYEKIASPEILDKKDAVYKANLTEEDVTDTINREISDWKNKENAEFLAEESKRRKSWNIPPNIKNKAENNK